MFDLPKQPVNMVTITMQWVDYWDMVKGVPLPTTLRDNAMRADYDSAIIDRINNSGIVDFKVVNYLPQPTYDDTVVLVLVGESPAHPAN